MVPNPAFGTNTIINRQYAGGFVILVKIPVKQMSSKMEKPSLGNDELQVSVDESTISSTTAGRIN